MNVAPEKGLIHARFDNILGSRTQVLRANVPALPARGELINLAGDPFIVSSIGWAIGSEEQDAGVIYAYVDVLPFKGKL